MAKVKAQISVSADGFSAGPNQGEEHPLGEGGEQLHEWVVKLAAWREAHGREGGEVNASSQVFEEASANTGAVVMGRNMFGPVRGPWTEPLWNGWWGEEPPFHVPVFVLTHYEREPLTLGETIFHFVTEGPERAIDLAREAAGGGDVSIGGGAETIQQHLRAGLLDELLLNQVPVVLGAGERLLDEIPPGVKLEQLRVIDAPGVAHLLYAVKS
ncbi:MAG TPA: dihydrofolate reductase family protein [Solirubrobacterales bacterium]|jgi:dihydrofolate reductase|nr:dihydrofolate reductase family protein [Solirubrobacterales bacterium]